MNITIDSQDMFYITLSIISLSLFILFILPKYLKRKIKEEENN